MASETATNTLGDSTPASAENEVCARARVPFEQPVCADERLTALLTKFRSAERVVDEQERCTSLEVEHLEPVTAYAGRFGDVSAGPGVFGTLDIDGDGESDVVRHYSSVDYWSWLFFVRASDCLRLVAAVEGYQVELTSKRHHGLRELRVLTYPLQGVIEIQRFDGHAYRSGGT